LTDENGNGEEQTGEDDKQAAVTHEAALYKAFLIDAAKY